MSNDAKKQLTELIRLVKSQDGCDVETTGDNHYRFMKNGVMVSTCGSTPSDMRAIRNTRADLKRHGILTNKAEIRRAKRDQRVSQQQEKEPVPATDPGRPTPASTGGRPTLAWEPVTPGGPSTPPPRPKTPVVPRTTPKGVAMGAMPVAPGQGRERILAAEVPAAASTPVVNHDVAPLPLETEVPTTRWVARHDDKPIAGKKYHLYRDCGRLDREQDYEPPRTYERDGVPETSWTPGIKHIEVSTDVCDLAGITICSTCEKRSKRNTIAGAIAAAVGVDKVVAVLDSLKESGYKVVEA